MNNTPVYGIAGIGIGPFNLGLAALANPIKELQCIFFDAKPAFSWHEGMLLDFSKLQVPFYADLVTAAEPSNPLSFLCYLKRNKRLYPFGVLEENYISRKEYNKYCQWVVSQLDTLRFGHSVSSITYDEATALYTLSVVNEDQTHLFYAKKIVIGVGSVPYLPCELDLYSLPDIIHSSDYLFHKKALLATENITVVGSGQSAAEIFYDLLLEKKGTTTKLTWITRAARFHPMETSKLTLEMTSPNYIHHFYRLSPQQKQATLEAQQFLYKGINAELLTAIYRQLYEEIEARDRFTLRTNCDLKHMEKVNSGYNLQFFHSDQQQLLEHKTGAVVMATGYKPAPVPFLDQICNRIRFTENGNYHTHPNFAVDEKGNEVFIQNAELHSHGFNAPDLGMGPYRNAVILNSILGHAYFEVEENTTFQTFGLD